MVSTSTDDQQKKLTDNLVLDFASIYNEFQPKILRYVTNIVNEFEAEDLTQEIFTKVSQALPRFRGESKPSTWLYRIATNASLDRLRSPGFRQATQRHESITSTEDIEADIDDRNIWTGEKIPIPETQVVRREMSECVQVYIHHLPEGYRTVLALSEFEGLSNQDIANILRVTVSTVKIRLHRARERLKKDLIENCPSYWVDGNEFLPDLKDL